MRNKDILAIREVRLWITRIIVPGIIAGTAIVSSMNPEFKNKVRNKVSGIMKRNKKDSNDIVSDEL